MRRLLVMISLMMSFVVLGSITAFATENNDFLEGYCMSEDEILVYCSNIAEGQIPEKEQFSVSLSGTQVEINNIVSTKSYWGVTYCVLVDISGSMQKEQLQLAQDTLTSICDQMDEYDNMLVGTLGNEVTFSELLSDKNTIREKIQGIEIISGQDTNLYKGIMDTVAMLSSDTRVNRKKCLIILSDGKDDQKTGITKEEAEKIVDESGIAVYTVAALKQNPSKEQVENAKLLGSFARISTGGIHFVPVLDGMDGYAVGEKIVTDVNGGILIFLDTSSYEAQKDELVLRVVYTGMDETIKEDSLHFYAEELQYNVPKQSVTPIPTPIPPSPDYTLYYIAGGIVLLITVVFGLLFLKKTKKNDVQDDTAWSDGSDGGDEVKADELKSDEETPRLMNTHPVTFCAIGYKDVTFTVHLQEGVWTTVGCGSEADINLIQFDRKLSKIQCQIRYEKGYLQVKNMSTENITFINGIPVQAMSTVMVKHEQKIRMGSYEYRILLKGQKGAK